MVVLLQESDNGGVTEYLVAAMANVTLLLSSLYFKWEVERGSALPKAIY